MDLLLGRKQRRGGYAAYLDFSTHTHTYTHTVSLNAETGLDEKRVGTPLIHTHCTSSGGDGPL